MHHEFWEAADVLMIDGSSLARLLAGATRHSGQESLEYLSGSLSGAAILSPRAKSLASDPLLGARVVCN